MPNLAELVNACICMCEQESGHAWNATGERERERPAECTTSVGVVAEGEVRAHVLLVAL